MSIHLAGIVGLVVIFALGTLRPVNLGVLALAMTFVVGSFVAHETPAEMYRGFPVDLFVLLTGVTYLFAIAERNGTLARIVDGSVRLARGRRALIPWVVFAVAAAPAMAGAIGSAGVALLAPISMRLAERCGIDRRLIGLMVVHGAAAGNFSPLNVLGAIVLQAAQSRGVPLSTWTLFAGNVLYNVVLGAIIVAIFSRSSSAAHAQAAPIATTTERQRREPPTLDRRAAETRTRQHGAGPRCGRRSSRWGSVSASASSRSPPEHCCSWRLRARRAAPSVKWRGPSSCWSAGS